MHICGEDVGLNAIVHAMAKGITNLDKIGGNNGGDKMPLHLGHGDAMSKANLKYEANVLKLVVTLILDFLKREPATRANLAGINQNA